MIFVNMKKTLLFFILRVVSIYAATDRFQANYDHFVMNEAHIQEYRLRGDSNSGYPPIFMECHVMGNSPCQPALPMINESEGYVTFVPNNSFDIYYGCLFKMDIPSDMLNSSKFETGILLRKTTRTFWPHRSMIRVPFWFKSYVNYYSYRCVSEISPTLWRGQNKPEGSYSIGFKFINHDELVLSTVEFDHAKLLPFRVQHSLYGESLAVPSAALNTREKIIYEEDSTVNLAKDLIIAFESYYKFNEDDSQTKKSLNFTLKKYNMNPIPEDSKISMAHLIPEYDMVQTIWRKVSYFAQTIAPMWTDLYLGVWADVEEMIREVAFQNQETLTIFSGTHGQLTFSEVSMTRNKFYLDAYGVAVPELIWKLVVKEKPYYEKGNKRAIVIILHNVTENLKNLNIFSPLKAPCESKCVSFQWNIIQKENMYCCTVNEVKNLINEFPQAAIDGNFDPLLYG